MEHCDHCIDHEQRILTGELRAQFQGQALRWIAIIAPILITTTFGILQVVK